MTYVKVIFLIFNYLQSFYYISQLSAQWSWVFNQSYLFLVQLTFLYEIYIYVYAYIAKNISFMHGFVRHSLISNILWSNNAQFSILYQSPNRLCALQMAQISIRSRRLLCQASFHLTTDKVRPKPITSWFHDEQLKDSNSQSKKKKLDINYVFMQEKNQREWTFCSACRILYILHIK